MTNRDYDFAPQFFKGEWSNIHDNEHLQRVRSCPLEHGGNLSLMDLGRVPQVMGTTLRFVLASKRRILRRSDTAEDRNAVEPRSGGRPRSPGEIGRAPWREKG